MRVENRTVKVWDLPLRLFHWLLVAAIAVAFLSSEEDSALNQWHIISGWVAGILLAFRMVWGLVGGEHSRFANFLHPSRIGDHISGLLRGHQEPTLGHNPLGAVAVVILLLLIAVTVWTGAFGGEAAEETHEVIAWLLLAMIAIHVSAVAIMSALERENLIRAMVTGRKPAARHPAAADARTPGATAVMVAVALVAGAAYSILQYDPQAFTLRSADAFEHRGEAMAPAGNSEEGREEDD
jgi:cytochrome b